jgi:hypothetical protein
LKMSSFVLLMKCAFSTSSIDMFCLLSIAAPSALCGSSRHSYRWGLQIQVEAESPSWLWAVHWRAIQAEAARRTGGSEGQCFIQSAFATLALPGDGHPQHSKVPKQRWRMAWPWRTMGQGKALSPKIHCTDVSTHEN